MKEYKNLLSCWHKLEHFSPASVPKGKNIELLSDKEPWKIPLKAKDPTKTIEYTIYLGVFDSSRVNDFVKEYFKDFTKDENSRNSKICFASLKLDIEGNYINQSLGISTLPWALGQLEKNEIESNEWEKTFEKIKNDLDEYVELIFKETITNSEKEIIAESTIVNGKQLLKLQDEIESLCGWSVKPNKYIYIKRDEKSKPQKDKEVKSTSEILNSFYIKDLEKIISKYDVKSSPKAFQQYLDGSLGNKSKRIDISKNIDELKNNLTPSNFPDGCWPSDYTLSLMQQFAVNNIFNQLSEDVKGGMFSVNGPPGTGKTTLLRDIIAPIIVKRAKELSKIDTPSDAFVEVGKIKINDNYSPWIYSPIKKISNAGIVIASSNNGAVENISKELPLKEEVSEQYRSEIGYFKSVAEKCFSEENWGIISAVLGNKQNRNNLVSSLWFNKDFKDLQKTLKEDKMDDNSKWELIKTLFNSKLEEIAAEKKRLEDIKNEYQNYVNTIKELSKITIEIDDFSRDQAATKINYEKQKVIVDELTTNKKEVINELSIIKGSKPNFFTYWFNKNKRNSYKRALDSALNSYNNLTEKIAMENPIFLGLEKELISLNSLLNEKETGKNNLANKLNLLKIKTDNAKLELKNNYADSEFWENIESKKSQESCPWYSAKLKKLQSEVFIIALKLNEIFILTANSKHSRISNTLAGFFEYTKGEINASKEEIKAMWDTFFLVIPVISSAFASIQTMFKDLNKEDIPWLFIDEAGQAIPQAAVGSIWRSKRVGVVGDPFQIEPVVTIPNSITDNISKYFDLDKNQISSELSVQSMADRINPLGSYLTINSKKEWIGIPLRVHRRCINPMFEISNSIAYDNTMYCSTANPKNVRVNFQTSFIHCKGNVEGRHYVQEQANKIKEILLSEITFSKNLPDIFIITPFSEISYQLRPFFFKHLIKEIQKYKGTDSAEMSNWLNTHIGTVHTFQGKQAEGVILCLGLDETSKSAASWASQKPNLLNVAITRAKYRFIAIGDEEIWLKQPYFKELKKLNKDATTIKKIPN